MEPWFLFAIISAVCAGLYSFSTKVSAHLGHHSAQVTMYSMLSATVLSGLYALFTSTNPSSLWLIIVIAIIDAVAYAMTSMTRIDALSFMDATLFFPLYKVASSLLAVPVGVLFFADILSGKELVGILIGLLAPIFLITKQEHQRQKNLSKGLRLLAVSVGATMIATVASKMIRILELDVSLYVFFAFSFSMIFTGWMYRGSVERLHKKRHVEWVGLLGGIFLFGNLFSFVRALSGNLSMVYLINSFSTVFVVFLSLLFFKEHINLKKIGALTVMVLSLVLLS